MDKVTRVGLLALMLAGGTVLSGSAATLTARTNQFIGATISGGLQSSSHTQPQRPPENPPPSTGLDTLKRLNGTTSNGGSTGANSCNGCTLKRIGP